MNFTEGEFKKFRKAVKLALSDIEREFEVDIKVDKIRYTLASFDCNLQVSKLDVDANYLDWIFHCEKYDLRPDDYNRILEVEGEQLQLLNLETSRRRYPIRCLKLRTGEEILYTSHAINEAIRNSKR